MIPSRDALRSAVRLSVGAEDWLVIGTACQEMGDRAAALGAFQRAARLDPRSPDAYRSLGAMLLAAGDARAAALTLRVAVGLDPSNPTAHVLLAHALSRLEKHAEALRYAHRALELAPASAPLLRELAHIFTRADQAADAESALRALLTVVPADIEARLELAELLLSRDERAQALEELRQVAQSAARTLASDLKLGQTFIALQELGEAVGVLRETAALHPESAEARFELGRALEAAGRLDEAIAALDAAVKLNPQWVAAHYHLGRLLERCSQSGFDLGMVTGELLLDADDTAIQRALSAMAQERDDTQQITHVGPAFQGDLSILVLTDTLEFLIGQGASGVLTLKGPRGEGRVDLIDGLGVRVISPKTKALFAILEETDALTTTEIKRLLGTRFDPQDDDRLLAGLLKSSAIERSRLKDALSAQALVGLSELLMWREGSVTFQSVPSESMAHDKALLFALPPLLKTAKRRLVAKSIGA